MDNAGFACVNGVTALSGNYLRQRACATVYRRMSRDRSLRPSDYSASQFAYLAVGFERLIDTDVESPGARQTVYPTPEGSPGKRQEMSGMAILSIGKRRAIRASGSGRKRKVTLYVSLFRLVCYG
jgi:hypothetical protein